MKTATPICDYASDAALLKRIPRNHIRSVLEHTIIDPRIDHSWDDSIAEHPEATIFHTSAWAKVLCDTYRHTPLYFRFKSGEHEDVLLPLMEVASPFTGRRGVSLPFSDFCAPLSFGASSPGHALVEGLATLSRERNWKYFELRSTPVASSALVPNKTFYAHKLDLQKPAAELLENFDSAARRAIRKAERSNISVEISRDENAIEQFFQLHARTRRRHGIPPQPRAFFQNIHKHIIQHGLGFMVLAHLNARPIAAAIFFHFGESALFKFGASDERHQEHRPNNLLMWQGIRHCQEFGLKTLHLGRTDVGQEGLRRFKLSLGAEEEMLRYFRFNASTSSWLPPSSTFSSSLPGGVFRRLPLTVNKLAGIMLYPHLH